LALGLYQQGTSLHDTPMTPHCMMEKAAYKKYITFQYIYPSIHAFVHEIKAEIRCTSVLPSTSADSKTSGIDVKISIGFKHQLTMYKQIVQFYR
jgi:hypothetical protein